MQLHPGTNSYTLKLLTTQLLPSSLYFFSLDVCVHMLVVLFVVQLFIAFQLLFLLFSNLSFFYAQQQFILLLLQLPSPFSILATDTVLVKLRVHLTHTLRRTGALSVAYAAWHQRTRSARSALSITRPFPRSSSSSSSSNK